MQSLRLGIAAPQDQQASSGEGCLVAIRGVVDGDGAVIPAGEVFTALRDGGESDEPSVGARRALYADIFSRLEAAGYISKQTNPGDRRLVALALTAEGRSLIAKIVPLALDYQARLVTELGKNRPTLGLALKTILDRGRDDPSA